MCFRLDSSYLLLHQQRQANVKKFFFFASLRSKFIYANSKYTNGLMCSSQAVKHLIRAAQNTSTEDSESIQMAIDVVAAANDAALTRQLIDFLMGEVDGIPKVRI